MGVIDALGDGYRIVVRRPYLIVIPVLLDLIIWLLPPISVLAPTATTTGSDSLGPGSIEFGREVSWLLGLFVPSIGLLAGDLDAGKSPIELTTIASTVVTIVTLVGIGVVIASVYLVLLANVIDARGETFDFAQAWGTKSPKLLGLVLGSGAVIALATGVFALVATVLGAAAGLLPGVFGIPLLLLLIALLIALLVGLVAASLVLYFAILALILEPVSVRASIRNSVIFLKSNRSPAIVFVFLTFIIQMGLGFIWSGLSGAIPGLIVSLLGSAFIGTAISAASMIFYLSRLREPKTIASNGLRA